MPRSAVALVRFAAPPASRTTDTQLLRTFISARTDDAFAELVRRHGPMVLAVCRRILSDAHDAEDAFQAVFLVLARKAGAVRGSNVAGWLYSVAVRTARGVRIMRDRRKHLLTAPGTRASAPTTPDALVVTEQAAIIDEELAKLPDFLREAVVMCELRGLSRKQAALELGIAEGTLSSRLAAAKRKLAERLSARGVTSAVALSALLPSVAVSAGLLRTTTAAVRGAAGGVANAAASTVLKGMLFDQLRAVALTAALVATVVCGGYAMTTSPGSPSDAKPLAPAPRLAEDPAAPLVKQLGSEDFNERETADKELRKLGSRAEPALKAGLKSENPEVRTRAAAILTVARKTALDDLVKTFDPTKADDEPSHPIWKRYRAITGNTRASRDLFALIVKHADWLHRLDTAEAGPESAEQQYREAMVHVGRHFLGNLRVFFEISVWPCDRGEETAYLMLLGSYPGTEKARSKCAGEEAELLLHGEGRVHFARGLELGLQGKILEQSPKFRPDAVDAAPGMNRVFGKLLASWLTHRTEPAVIYCAFELAVKWRIADVLSAARTIAADKGRGPDSRCAALHAVAQFGNIADLPLFTPLYDDPTALVVPPSPSVGLGPRSRRMQVSDHAIGLALLLCDQDPFEFGFPYAQNRFARENGRPVVAVYFGEPFGFSNEEARTAAHTKARAFLDKQKDVVKPDPAHMKFVEQLGSEDFAEREAAQKQLKELGSKARAALEIGLKSGNAEITKRCRELLDQLFRAEFDATHWKRFAKVIGDDKPSRALFERIRSLPHNVALLDAVAADPSTAGKLYHDRWAELNKAARIPIGVGSFQLVAAPLADVVGWMYLGTFPGTEGAFHTSHSLDFLPGGKHSNDAIAAALKDKTVAPAIRQLVGKWTAARVDYTGRAHGLQLALDFGIEEVLPAARETVRAKVKDDPYPGNTARNVGLAILAVGKLGTKDDLPLLEAHAANGAQSGVFLHDPPTKPGEPVFRIYRTPVEGQDTTTQLRDVATAMRLHLLGQDPDDFGFYWRWPHGPDAGKRMNPEDRFGPYSVGFLRDADRVAAHKKAKEWFDKQKK
ncbi:sigma-70 family RNA polymerase sigma factor [Gemmata sp. G18]|uniref:Sigma-70 family RNA polymerase sigma factor n=1 Tax=Gemmata palustris TaxID=2822762 RepID=A0ABS5BM35_9BACT|nr:sigma-70 family RNA polymerase sigma factor [Gemmata palustris]MBP3954735.1 sigma-70 family RNA polymerase sigma factor [Gemmata palustris]